MNSARTSHISAVFALVAIAPLVHASSPVISTQGPGGVIPTVCVEVSCKFGAPWNSVPTWADLTSAVTVPHDLDGVTSVVIMGLQHTWRGDVHVYLENPAGQMFNLIVRPGSHGSSGDGDSGNFQTGEYRLVESGAQSLQQGDANIFGGTYNQYLNKGPGRWTSALFPIANLPLGAITGTAGTWKLHLRDWFPEDGGSITGWWLEGENDAAIGFCSGDGSTIACPCSNNGAAEHGCANYFFPNGASLGAYGTPSVSADSMVFEARNVTSSVCVFFQGSAQIPPSVIDDGLGCVGGSLIRIGTKRVVSYTSSYPQPGDPAISVKGAVDPLGATRYYQAYYRDSIPFWCPPASSNRTNGQIVTWAP